MRIKIYVSLKILGVYLRIVYIYLNCILNSLDVFYYAFKVYDGMPKFMSTKVYLG